LGRGLDFLLSGSDDGESPAPTGPQEIPVGDVSSNPWQPREAFDEKALEELSLSIKKLGVVQPIVVRPKDGGGFELVAGERRLLASRRAGLEVIPALVRAVDDDDMLAIALVENVQRQDLNPVERSRAFHRLAEEQKMSHKQIAEASGLARSTVSNSLRLLELSNPMLKAVESGRLTEGHARALLAETDPKLRGDLFKRLVEEKLSVRSAEEGVSSPGRAAKKSSRRSSEAAVLEKQLSDHLGSNARIMERGKGGRIVLQYRTLEEFDRLFRLLTGESPDV
jgi:ParB family chromosome partitioning protein